MESTARTSTGSISLLVLYKAVIIFSHHESIRISHHGTSYKEVLHDEAAEEWYAQRDPDEVEHEEQQLYAFSSTILSPYERVQRTIFHLCTLSISNTKCSSISRELSPTHALYIGTGTIFTMVQLNINWSWT